MKLSSIKAWAAALLAGLGCGRLLACGPDFPNSFLDTGDTVLLVAPRLDFYSEMGRLKPAPDGFLAVTNEGTFAEQSAAAELRDLAAALQAAGGTDQEVAAICASHRIEREKLSAYLRGVARSAASRPLLWDEKANKSTRGPPTAPRPEFPRIVTVRGLPDEFADYFSGAVAWANPALTNKEEALDAWRDVMSLPSPERRYKSTWAAFMLGKALQKTEPARAIAYFQRVRELCGHGFADSLGLGAASLGLEAQTQWQQGKTAEAMELYLEQLATGDQTAEASLFITASTAVNQDKAEGLAELAANATVRPVITAYLLADHSLEPVGVPRPTAREKWLAAVQATGVTDVDSAEEFALTAYQAGEWEAAQGWIVRARSTPTAQWLQAKLWLRAGKVDQAAALLDKVTALFPLDQPATNAPGQFKDELTLPGWTYDYEEETPQVGGGSRMISASRQVLGETGVLHLARREYSEALDALLRSGFWMDAAYVAERVLTVDELKTYVDRDWPAAAEVKQNSTETTGANKAPDFGAQIRHLLARRLARLHRASEARAYYPPAWRPQADALSDDLAKGADGAASAEDRAKALFAAAKITATNGLELLGTETAPDWAIHGGEYQGGVDLASRTSTNITLVRASEDELRRASQSGPEPDARFHYRYQAAALGWQAALLMPDESEDTARVLCQAGSWIKNLDPKQADVFYKALVRRCRHTEIGDQADRMRWFPVLDANGQPLPFNPPAAK